MLQRCILIAIVMWVFCAPAVSQEKPSGPDRRVVVTPEMVEAANHQREVLSNPHFFRLQLIRAWVELGESEKLAKIPYKVGDRIAFHLSISHELTEPIDITITDIYDQIRPQLFWDGQLVPYKKNVTELVEIKDKEYQVFREKPVRLVSGKSHRMEVIDLADWYKKPEPGHYVLSARRRFVWGGGWAESDAVAFEVVAAASHQSNSDLTQLSDLIETAAKEKMPEWKYWRGEPVYEGEHVLIAAFSSGDKRVKVSVLPYPSRAEAERALHHYVNRDKSQKKLDDFGDEGFSCGFANSQVVFRKRNLTVFVSITADEMNKEVVEINKQFAKLIASALPN